MFSLVKGIQKPKCFSPYCESDFFNGARYITMGLETRRLKNAIDIEPVPGNLLKFILCKYKLSEKSMQ